MQGLVCAPLFRKLLASCVTFSCVCFCLKCFRIYSAFSVILMRIAFQSGHRLHRINQLARPSEIRPHGLSPAVDAVPKSSHLNMELYRVVVCGLRNMNMDVLPFSPVRLQQPRPLLDCGPPCYCSSSQARIVPFRTWVFCSGPRSLQPYLSEPVMPLSGFGPPSC